MLLVVVVQKIPPVEFLKSVKVHLQLCGQCPTTCLELGALAQSGMKVAFLNRGKTGEMVGENPNKTGGMV